MKINFKMSYLKKFVADFTSKNDIFIIDGDTGLQISKTDLDEHTWYNAIKLCKNYNGGGFNDWRLTTKDDFLKLVNNIRAIELKLDYYWTSYDNFTLSNDIALAFVRSGRTIKSFKREKRYVLPVRNLTEYEIDAIKYNL